MHIAQGWPGGQFVCCLLCLRRQSPPSTGFIFFSPRLFLNSCQHQHQQVITVWNPCQYHFSVGVISGLTMVGQTSKISLYHKFPLLFFVLTQIFPFLACCLKVKVMSCGLLRFSFLFQFHVLVDTDTYKASILI